MTQGARNDQGEEQEEQQQADDVQAATGTLPARPTGFAPSPASPPTDLVPPPVAARAPTGDDAVDDVLGQLDAVADEPLDSQIRAGELVHRVLQGRLADLGKE